MNVLAVIAIIGFGLFIVTGILIIIGTILGWKPLVDPKEDQWIFGLQYQIKNILGKPFVIILNLIIGLIFILISLPAFLRLAN